MHRAQLVRRAVRLLGAAAATGALSVAVLATAPAQASVTGSHHASFANGLKVSAANGLSRGSDANGLSYGSSANGLSVHYSQANGL